MSDGHLYLADDAVAFAGDVRAAWYDEGHDSMLFVETSTKQLHEVSLHHSMRQHHTPEGYTEATKGRAKPLMARSKSAPVLATDEASSSLGPHGRAATNVVFDFSRASLRHAPGDPTLLVRLSLDREFLAVQRSDVEVQIIRVATGESYWIVCQSKRGNRILPDGVLWNTHATLPQSSQDLFLVTRFGIEQYRVSPKRRSCALHRTIGVYVHTFWYSSTHSVLIISTGSRANEIVPFAMQGMSVEKLPRLVFSNSLMKKDVYLAALYGDLYAVYCDLKATRLLMYRVTKEKVSCVRSLHLMLPPGSPVEFSVVDNLLVCHSVEFSVSFFFDVKCDLGVHNPFSHPLPVSLAPPTVSRNSQARFKSTPHVVSVIDPTSEGAERQYDAVSITSLLLQPSHDPASEAVSASQTTSHLYHHDPGDLDTKNRPSSPWQFLSPDLVQRSSSGAEDSTVARIEIRRFHLNLEQIRQSCAQHAEILPFLLRRGHQSLAKQLALSIVRERLEDESLSPGAAHASLATVQTLSGDGGSSVSDESGNEISSDDEPQLRFAPRAVVPVSFRKRFFRAESMSPTSFSSRLPSRNANGLTLTFQSDFYEFVWGPLLDSSSVSIRASLSSYILTFIQNLEQSQVPVDSITDTTLAKAFLQAGQYSELVQMVQERAMDDSLVLADLLVRHLNQHPAFQQLALAMYTRLEATAAVVQLLLDVSQIDQATVFAWKNMKPGVCDSSIIPGVRFFQACVQQLKSQPQSPLVVQQRLRSLLLFLRIWDSECLIGEPSALATHCMITTFEDLLPASTAQRWYKNFGFVVEEGAMSHSAGE